MTQFKKKALVVIYTGDDWEKPATQLPPGTQRGFEIWQKILKAKGYELGRASIKWFAEGAFRKYWHITSDGTWEKVTDPLEPEYLYDKTRSYDRKTGQPIFDVFAIKQDLNEKIPMINSPEFTNLITNKLNQAVIFSKFMPSTKLLLPGSKVINPTKDNVVLKRLYGSGGEQVKISDAKSIGIKELLVQQEFVKATKNGELKDIRVGFVGDEPQYAYYRIAKKGELFTNVHMGASMKFERLDKLKSLLKFSEEIARPLQVFPKRVYSLDYLIDATTEKPFLIEANSMPGFENFPDSALEKFYSSLTKLFFSR